MGINAITRGFVAKTLFAAAVVAAGSLAGCGGDNKDSSTSGPGMGSAPPTGGGGSPSPGPAPSPAPIPGPIAGGFWSGVTLMDNATVLNKASILFAGRNPTATEFAGATTDAGVRQTIRGYMQGPAFEAWLNEAAETHLLTPGVIAFGNNTGLNAADYPASATDLINNANNFNGAIRTRVQRSLQLEPVKLIEYLVVNERPWTEAVTADYTVANGVLAQYFGLTVSGVTVDANDDAIWGRSTMPMNPRLNRVQDRAGVLGTHAWLQRHPTTDTNTNRHRVYAMGVQFLATDFASLAARPVDDAAAFKIQTVENPGCATCHAQIDPMAAGFQNYPSTNRDRPFVVNNQPNALPNVYRANNYPLVCSATADGMPGDARCFRDGDNWMRDRHAPLPQIGYNNPDALKTLGGIVAADSRFALGGVHFWYQYTFGRKPLRAPTDPTDPQFANRQSAYTAQNEEFQAIAAAFRTNRGNGAFNVKDLLVDLVTSKWFRAQAVTGLNAGRAIELHDVGSVNLITAAQLNRKLTSLLGVTYAGFNRNAAGGFNTEGLNYSNWNGNDRTVWQREITTMQTTVLDRLATSQSCNIAMTDFNKAQAQRLLFPNVTMADTPDGAAGEAAIVANIRYLHKHLWKEDLQANDPEVVRTLNLFKAVWNDRATAPVRPTNCAYNAGNDANYTGRAWSTVVAYMIGDAKFIFE
jgi:hypothetical protein